MSLITDIQTIIKGLYPDATYTLSSKFKANVQSFIMETTEFPLIILNNEIAKNNEININNNILKDTGIKIMILSPDDVDNTDAQSEDIRQAMEDHADRIAVNIYQLLEVRPLSRQKYRTDPLFHVFNTNLTGVTLDMQVNYNEIVNFNKPVEDEV